MSFSPRIFSNYTPAEADWGIEEFSGSRRYHSATGSELSYPLRVPIHPLESSYGRDPSGPGDACPVITATTENFHKFITKYLSFRDFKSLVLDKFKYNLVVSNLLDESLVLSKNEQALTNLQELSSQQDGTLPDLFTCWRNDTTIKVQVILRQYRLSSSRLLGNPCLLLNTISLIIFLLKQNMSLRSLLPHITRVRIFRILLIVSSKIVNFKRIWTSVEASKIIRNLDDFTITNCKINKAIITNILSIKELEMFTFLNESGSTPRTPAEYSNDLKAHLNGILESLILNAKYSIRKLLPLSNGDILEKYCDINNIPLGSMLNLLEPSDVLSVEYLTSKLSLFNGLRRFLVCQLLTLHDPHMHNFFILKLCDYFNVNLDNYPTFISSSYKLKVFCDIFQEHASSLKQILIHNSQFKAMRCYDQAVDYVNDDVLSSINQQPPEKFAEDFSFSDSDLPLSQLIDKLQSLATSLKYFKKYKNSIVSNENAEEHEEKISIFDLFDKELKGINNLYKSCVNDLNHEFNVNFLGGSAPSSCSTSNRNSYNIEQFNPKAFHTASRSSRRQVSFLANKIEEPVAATDKRLKRLSVGLQLGLLTVVEEPIKRLPRTELTRGTYIDKNRLPNLQDTFDIKAYEALTKRTEMKASNRYSMYSLNSNISGISDLIASTNITTDCESPDLTKLNETDPSYMSKTEFKEKLEESYSRVLNLQNDSDPTLVEPIVYSEHEKNNLESDLLSSNVIKDAAFLSDLEKSLNIKTSTI